MNEIDAIDEGTFEDDLEETWIAEQARLLTLEDGSDAAA